MAAALSLGGASASRGRAPLSLCTSSGTSARHGRRRHTSARHYGRRPSSSKALAVGDVSLAVGDVSVAASSSLVSLSATQALLGKVAFGSLLGTTGVYWGKAAFSNRKENTDDSSGSSTSSSKETTTSRPLEQYGVLAANASLFLLLTARWLESGHFPLSNIYESLMFLAWGVLATQMFVERKAAGESGRLLLGALATPTALLAVGGATLALPPELQKSAALVPALKSNWLMMHVTVMMMSYAALMVGSLLAAGFVGLDVYLELTKGADSSSSTAGAITENESMDGGEAGSAAVAAVGMDGGEAGSAAVATVVSNAPHCFQDVATQGSWSSTVSATARLGLDLLCSRWASSPVQFGQTRRGVRTGAGIRRRHGRSSAGLCTQATCTHASSPAGVRVMPRLWVRLALSSCGSATLA